jgi:hypothetical protein
VQRAAQKPPVQLTAVAGVELSRCAEPNADSIECINLIESVRLKKDVMEHHNDKGISMKYVQTKPYYPFKTALQLRASIKKSKFLLHKAYQLTWTRQRPSPTSDLCFANSATHKY